MTNHDEQHIETLVENNPELKTLWDEHMLLSKQVEKLESKAFLTPNEDVELKQLKKQKLDNKTTLHQKIDAIQA